MTYLTFQLQAPLASWGETAVGEYRPSANYPGQSALLGLIAAALGVHRDEEDKHQQLNAGLRFAVGILADGELLRDYHTIQVPGRVSLKNRPHSTRREELQVPKEELKTILSSRDYRQNATYLVAVYAREDSIFSLREVARAIEQPRFTLYLGRKSCPPSLPLWPQLIDENNALSALMKYHERLSKIRMDNVLGPIEKLVWGDGVESGVNFDLQTNRKDRLISRRQWQFGDRQEYIALLGD